MNEYLTGDGGVHGAGGNGLANNPLPADGPHRLSIRFTGSGSEYFRIWIVNLLLLMVTFGIYYPWAKVRRLRYFFGNTVVGGDPLDFHGEPLKILLGYFMMGILFSIYSTLGNVSALAGLTGFLAVAAIWPALLVSAMRFRMANTSWRGLRFGFRGSMGDAYHALIPMFVPGILILAAVTRVGDSKNPPGWFFPAFGLIMLATLGVIPWMLWKFKKYQHDHYAFASLQTSFTATAGSFYKVFFRMLGVALLVIVLTGVLVAGAYFAMRGGAPSPKSGRAAMALAAGVTPLLAMLALFVLAKPYVIARFQNVIWSHTVNDSVRFSSDLRFGRVLLLTLKNWLLIVLTLGFYWPFAAVAMARLRLEAVSAETRDDPQLLVSQANAAEGAAAGDAGADLLGLDIGL
ncbi:MAG: YjgN family protein [Pseudomonadota bacterium]